MVCTTRVYIRCTPTLGGVQLVVSLLTGDANTVGLQTDLPQSNDQAVCAYTERIWCSHTHNLLKLIPLIAIEIQKFRYYELCNSQDSCSLKTGLPTWD